MESPLERALQGHVGMTPGSGLPIADVDITIGEDPDGLDPAENDFARIAHFESMTWGADLTDAEYDQLLE